MKEIQSAAIVGAGALGLMYADAFSGVLNENVRFLAEGKRVERINTSTFAINGRDIQFSAVMPDESLRPDLVLVAVKNHHLEAILPLLERVVRSETLIISVLNGIESEKFLEEHLPAGKVLYSVAVGMDAVKEGNSLNFSTPGRLILGTADNNQNDPDLLSAVGFLEHCGVACEVPEDIHRSLWWKWMINIGTNQVSAVTGATYGVFQQDGDLQALMNDAMYETVRVARAEGVDLREEDVPGWYPILNSLGAGGKTSMLQDVEAGRKTEVEAFSGKLIELARRHEIPVPVNETLFRIIKTKELLYLPKTRLTES